MKAFKEYDMDKEELRSKIDEAIDRVTATPVDMNLKNNVIDTLSNLADFNIVIVDQNLSIKDTEVYYHIQDAISDMKEDVFICVYPGIYDEELDFTGCKNINLISIPYNDSIIDRIEHMHEPIDNSILPTIPMPKSRGMDIIIQGFNIDCNK